MDDPAFRRAVAAVIDREFIANALLGGLVAPMEGYVPEANPLWRLETVSRRRRFADAVRILEEAGYTWRTKPRVAADGEPAVPGEGLAPPGGRPLAALTLLAPNETSDPLRSAVAHYVEERLEALGIEVEIVFGDFDTVAHRIFFQHDFDMHLLGWDLGDPAYPEYLAAFFNPDEAAPGGWNTGGYASPEYARLAQAFGAARTLAEARRIAREMQAVLVRDQVYVVLFATKIVEAYREDRIDLPFEEALGGIQGAPDGLAPYIRIR